MTLQNLVYKKDRLYDKSSNVFSRLNTSNSDGVTTELERVKAIWFFVFFTYQGQNNIAIKMLQKDAFQSNLMIHSW
jgi:hypothetical protein